MKPEQVAQILNTLGDSAQLFRNNEFSQLPLTKVRGL